MLIDGNDLNTSQLIDADLCIVGAGPAGIVLARELINFFDDVVLLEAGGQNYSPESQELYEPAEAPHNYPNPSISRLRLLGGSSNHWANNTSPLDPIDFEKRDWVRNSGWPIHYDDVAPYYKRAAVHCGTGNDGYALKHWVGKLGENDPLAQSTILQSGIAKAATPPTRFFEKYGEELRASKRLRIYTNSSLVDLEFDKSSKVVKEVMFKSNANMGMTHRVQARAFVFAMGGIENARMLLYFNQKYNNALGNEFDNVGRYFMDHPLPRAAIFYAKNPSQYNFYKGTFLTDRRVLAFFKLTEKQQMESRVNNLRMPLVESSNYSLSDGISSYHILAESLEQFEIADDFGHHLVNILSDLDMVSEAISRRVWNKKLFDHADEVGGFLIPMTMEQTPHRNNRIELGSVVDRYNIPKIVIKWEVKQEDKDQLWKALEITAGALGALSLGRIRMLQEREDRLWGDQLGFGHHHMGTTRMAESSKTGVVDKNQKVFEAKNLFMAGSSVFTTGGHVPPTLTIIALTLRLADFLVEEYSSD